MYIAPGFTIITCESVSEEAFRAWAEANGGVWHPEESEPYRLARVIWEFSSGCEIVARLGTPSEHDVAEWTPQMYAPPQGVIDVEIEEYPNNDEEQWTPLISALFAQWDSYACDSTPEWVRTLLGEILPADRIIRYEPSPSAGPAWIWINGKYTKNEAYYDNLDASTARDES